MKLKDAIFFSHQSTTTAQQPLTYSRYISISLASYHALFIGTHPSSPTWGKKNESKKIHLKNYDDKSSS